MIQVIIKKRTGAAIAEAVAEAMAPFALSLSVVRKVLRVPVSTRRNGHALDGLRLFVLVHGEARLEESKDKVRTYGGSFYRVSIRGMNRV